MIMLDEELGRAVGIKRLSGGETMPRDEVLKKLRAGVNWSVSVGGVIK
jgi:translation initiation factor 2D